MSELNVNVRPNGPYLLAGPLVITDPTGQEINVPEGTNVALCRCGLSTEKPFCTGTHKAEGFAADEAITRTF
jgi:CDGSH-type Zn-finger protein